MIVCQRVVCWRVRTSRARSRVVALAGLRRRRVRIRQFLRSLKPCSTGARAADRAWLACRWAGVVLLVRVDFHPVMMTGSPGGDAVVAGGGDLAGGARHAAGGFVIGCLVGDD